MCRHIFRFITFKLKCTKLYSIPSIQVRTQLMFMLEVLDKSLKTIHPDKIKIENNALRQKIVEAYHSSKARDHQRILSRYDLSDFSIVSCR